MTALLEDTAVQRRVQQDPELRAMWSDPAVRQYVTAMPERATGMARLMELVRLLTEDSAVLDRIRADPALRELWSRPGVRQHIQPSARP
jgi:DTW domain-containing protein YfiP